mmetsp:Transcript_6378/g.11358  ORF Transcript_6378/g.11358 Transcript_6378/m.11358 type:complete len:87 (+) Transcript_6378:1457-1717(+)
MATSKSRVSSRPFDGVSGNDPQLDGELSILRLFPGDLGLRAEISSSSSSCDLIEYNISASVNGWWLFRQAVNFSTRSNEAFTRFTG